MSTATPQTYAATLEAARIAALNALTDILKTSDDPTERRHAATAILRAPEPSPPPALQPDSPRGQPVNGPLDPRAIIPGANMTAAEVVAGAKRILSAEHDQHVTAPRTSPEPNVPPRHAPHAPAYLRASATRAAKRASVAGASP